ncbi:MAG: hypothetical protein PCFJNLEI_03000 [Verrucomicrobiae bacterium]|nr:hypothetical protein [Verrucomicrobiae bacterium]
MNSRQNVLLAICATTVFVTGIVKADQLAAEPPAHVHILDNLYLNAGTGWEKPSGEDSTPFGQFGANWALPLTQPDTLAIGVQLGSNLKFREDDPEWNTTFGAFGRNIQTFPDRQGAVALLFDYRHTAFHNDLWAIRPIIGTTVSDQDALGIEGVAGLNNEGGEKITDQFTTFWTRDWQNNFTTEFGIGYQFSHVDETLFRGRCAVSLSEYIALAFGGDINTAGNYAIGIGVSYHFGGTGRHAFLHNISGTGAAAYTPFADSGFPELVQRSR